MKIYTAIFLLILLCGCGYKGPIEPNTIDLSTQNIHGSL